MVYGVTDREGYITYRNGDILIYDSNIIIYGGVSTKKNGIG